MNPDRRKTSGWLVVGLFLVSTASNVGAQSLEDQERLNQYDKAISAIDKLKVLADDMANEKRTQCVTAIGNSKQCECIASNLPVVINFVQYVSIITQTKEELEYNKLSQENRQIVDNVRATRDKCAIRTR